MSTHSPIAEKNFALLKRFHHDTWAKLNQWPHATTGELLRTSTGHDDLRLVATSGQTVYLHGQSPEADATTYLAKIPETSTGVVVLLGFGLGYVPLAIARNRPEIQQILIYEVDPGILKQALTHVDLASLLMDHRVSLHLAPFPALEKTLEKAAITIQLEDTHFINHLASFVCNSEYHTLKNNLYPIINRYNVGGATAFKIGRTFLKNRLQNLEAIRHHHLLDELKNKFSGMPAILVGGGPSLNKNVHQLRAIGDRALIIAVDSTLPTLKAHNITPHFVSTLDPDEVIYEKMADCAPHMAGVSLLCMLQTATSIAKTFPARKVFWGLGDSLVEQWLSPLLGAQCCTDEALTVANLSLAAAITMGAHPIIIMGQDLAYTNFETHAAHTVLDNKDFVEELKNKKDDLVWVKGIDGKQVPTDRGFFSAKNHFESLIAKNPNLYINATEGGAHIEGTIPLPLREALAQHCNIGIGTAAHLTALFAGMAPVETSGFLAEGTAIIQQIKKLKTLIVASQKIGKNISKQLDASYKKGKSFSSFQQLPSPVKNGFAEVDSLNSQIEKHHRLWQLLQDITLPGLKKSERLRSKMQQIQDNPKTFTKWLDLYLQRFAIIDESRLDALSFFEDLLDLVLKNMRTEERLLQEIAQEGASAERLDKLARHYLDTENFVGAKPVTEQLREIAPASANADLYLGCVLTAQRDHQKANEYFTLAKRTNPDSAQRINAFLFSQGDRFLDYSKIYQDVDRNTSLNLLLKGLFFYPAHQGIRDEIRNYATQDLGKIRTAISNDQPEHTKRLIRIWVTHLQRDEALASFLPAEQQADFMYAHALVMAVEGQIEEAQTSLQNALTLCPENAEYCSAMMQLKFACGDYSEGIFFLQKATNIDKSYARYWENLGDILHTAGQHSDAIVAYERYCLALPPHAAVLTKIGKCYLALGKNEAALEAMRQAKIHTSQDYALTGG